MKTTFKIIPAFVIGLTACAADGGIEITAERAQTLAEEILGDGVASEAEREDLDGQPIWEVHVAMPNGADVEVKLHAESEDLLVIEDKTGPFDYADFTPVEGLLSYEVVRDLAYDEVPGAVEAWEFERESADPADEAEYEYEFYVRNDEGELWEIKFHADDGEATHIELKDMVDP
jgi:uncharacterized membrane protein YkoI